MSSLWSLPPHILRGHWFIYCSKGALTPNCDDVRTYVRAYVRACVHTSRWKILFTPYLMVEQSPSAEIWCAYVTSINDGTQILIFLWIDNNRDFQNSRFFCGDLIILNHEVHWFRFSDRLYLLNLFSKQRTHSYDKEYLSRMLAEMSVLGIPLHWIRMSDLRHCAVW